MSARLADVLKTIQDIREIYPFKAEDTFMELDNEALSRSPQVKLHTMDENGFDILISKKVVRECE